MYNCFMAKRKLYPKTQHGLDFIHQYDKDNYKKITIRIKKDDVDVLNKLDDVDSKNGYIVELIRNDIKKIK